jgi:hypothetical protein
MKTRQHYYAQLCESDLEQGLKEIYDSDYFISYILSKILKKNSSTSDFLSQWTWIFATKLMKQYRNELIVKYDMHFYLILQNICSSANKKDKIGLRNSLFYNICS